MNSSVNSVISAYLRRQEARERQIDAIEWEIVRLTEQLSALRADRRELAETIRLVEDSTYYWNEENTAV